MTDEALPLAQGCYDFRFVVNKAGRSANTPNVVEPGTVMSFSGDVGPSKACVRFHYNKPVKVERGTDFVSALGATRLAAKQLGLAVAVRGVPYWHGATFTGLL